MPFTDQNNRLRVPDLIRHAVIAWIFAALIEYLLLPSGLRSLADLSGLAQMSLPRTLLVTCAGTAALTALSRFADSRAAQRWMLLGGFSVLAALSLFASFTPAFLVVCLLTAAILAVYGVFGWNGSVEPEPICAKERKLYLWLTAGMTFGFFLFVCAWTLGRIYTFNTPTFDFGLFSQMYYYMKETGLPLTTVERDGLLSHLNVHFSPIYYLLLPFYYLAPTPATLQVMQAAVISSAVIPLWKIGRHYGLPAFQRMLLCALLLLYPAFSGGASFDLHENCFLTPLILWLLYGMSSGKTAVTAASALLTLMVKEDAAVYVAIAALYLVIKSLIAPKKDVKGVVTGVLLIAGSLICFFLTTGYLASSGDGVMTYRYNNFIYDESASLITVIKAVIMSPMKVFYESVDSEKLLFIAQTILPLLGLPLLTRRYERYILLIPYVLINLMSDYLFQHSILFQYTFGSIAFLLFLTAVNLADLKANRRSLALIAAFLVSLGCFAQTNLSLGLNPPKKAILNYSHYQHIRDTLSKIPDDASVTASECYTTFLSQREILHDVFYSSTESMLETEYVVLDIYNTWRDYKKFSEDGTSEERGLANLKTLLAENGYALVDSIEDVLLIYQKQP